MSLAWLRKRLRVHKRNAHHHHEVEQHAHARWLVSRQLIRKYRRRIARKQHRAHAADAPSVMYDSTELSQVPADAPAVAGYVGGRWPTFREIPGRFPHARHVSIAVASTQDADVLDIEPGDAPPELAPGWVKRQQARGVKRPILYTSLSGAAHLLSILASHGIERSEVRLWLAHYTHHEHVCDHGCGFGLSTTADATQWTDRALGRTLDQSCCRPSFWEAS